MTSESISRVTAFSAAAQSKEPTINIDAALQRMGNDSNILKQLAAFYLEDISRMFAELEAAVQACDSKAVHYSAHTICGLSSNFDAFPTINVARRIEQAGRDQKLDICKTLLEPLKLEIEKVIMELKTFLANC